MQSQDPLPSFFFFSSSLTFWCFPLEKQCVFYNKLCVRQPQNKKREWGSSLF